QLGPAIHVAGGPVLVEFAAALVAVASPQVVLAATLLAAVGQLAGRHGHERALGAFDDLQIAHDEGVVERDRAEGLQALVLAVVFHELNADFGDNHSGSPFFLWHSEPARPKVHEGSDLIGRLALKATANDESQPSSGPRVGSTALLRSGAQPADHPQGLAVV